MQNFSNCEQIFFWKKRLRIALYYLNTLSTYCQNFVKFFLQMWVYFTSLRYALMFFWNMSFELCERYFKYFQLIDNKTMFWVLYSIANILYFLYICSENYDNEHYSLKNKLHCEKIEFVICNTEIILFVNKVLNTLKKLW